MRTLTMTILAVMVLMLAAPAARADALIAAQTTMFYFNGQYTDCDAGGVCNPVATLPAYWNTGGYDWATGLGTITASVNTPGLYQLLVFIDHDIDSLLNTWFNELGGALGAAPAGLSWEVGEPGYMGGQVHNNAKAFTLTNAVDLPGGGPEDISMALGQQFLLHAGDTATVNWVATTQQGKSPFYLHQSDPDSAADIWFTTTLNINNGGTPDIPEPGSLLLLGSGLAFLAYRKLRS